MTVFAAVSCTSSGIILSSPGSETVSFTFALFGALLGGGLSLDTRWKLSWR